MCVLIADVDGQLVAYHALSMDSACMCWCEGTRCWREWY
jgi:hypothetical protein